MVKTLKLYMLRGKSRKGKKKVAFSALSVGEVIRLVLVAVPRRRDLAEQFTQEAQPSCLNRLPTSD